MSKIKVVEQPLSVKISSSIKIALVSDLEITRKSIPMTEKLVDKLNENPVDIILILGDFVRSFTDIHLLDVLSNINNNRIYSVLGNHDYGISTKRGSPDFKMAKEVENYLSSIDIRVLRNSIEEVKVRDNVISIAGIEDIWAVPEIWDLPDNVDILMSHNPDVIYNKISDKADLIVSGHTHGGSIHWFPGKKFITYFNSKAGAQKPRGLIKYKGRRVFITSGVAKVLGIIRVGVAPEVVILELTPEEAPQIPSYNSRET